MVNWYRSVRRGEINGPFAGTDTLLRRCQELGGCNRIQRSLHKARTSASAAARCGARWMHRRVANAPAAEQYTSGRLAELLLPVVSVRAVAGLGRELRVLHPAGAIIAVQVLVQHQLE